MIYLQYIYPVRNFEYFLTSPNNTIGFVRSLLSVIIIDTSVISLKFTISI